MVELDAFETFRWVRRFFFLASLPIYLEKGRVGVAAEATGQGRKAYSGVGGRDILMKSGTRIRPEAARSVGWMFTASLPSGECCEGIG